MPDCRPLRLAAAAWALSLVGLLGGCAEPAAKPVAVRAIGEKEFAQVLQQHRGKVVLVDFWATWCAPCVAMFPHTVALHRQHADRGLAVISVSMDEPADEQKVLAFLQSQGAAFDNFISRYGTGSESFEAFGIDDGTVPHVQLYDHQGKLHKRFGGSFTAGDVDKAVQELLER